MRRLLILMAMAIPLAACGRDAAAPLLDSRAPPALGPRFYPPEGFAWGVLSEAKGPGRRYGVASPSTTPRAQVVIVSGQGESVEVYYETARDLVAKGWTVWMIDPPKSPRLGPDGLSRLIRSVIRPQPTRPLVVLGHGTGVVDVLAALEAGAPADGVVLTDPKLDEPLAATARERVSTGLGFLPADGEGLWKRPDYALGGRATLAEAWRTANPDLRPKPRVWSWFAERAALAETTLDPGRLKAAALPVLMLDAGPDAQERRLCAALPRCTAEPVTPMKPAPYLALDTERAAWLAKVAAFVQARVEDKAHGL